MPTISGLLAGLFKKLDISSSPTAPHPSGLCIVCQKIPEGLIFGHAYHDDKALRPLSMILGSYNEISSRRQCCFCQLVTNALKKYALHSLDGRSNRKARNLQLSVIREQKHSGEAIARIRLLGLDGIEDDLLEVQPIRVNPFTHVSAQLNAPGIHTIELEARNIDRIKDWMQACQRSHDSCRAVKPQMVSLPGFHLIDVNEKSIVDATLDMDFVALSYVWGSSTKLKNRKFQKILPDHLPKTIRDAIDATRMIGIPHIWVDALCIPQDDIMVKSEQIAQMDKIYRSAAVVFVAATGSDADHGLRGLTRAAESLQEAVWLNGVYVTCLPFSVKLRGQPIFSPWSTRGWTLQEGVLAQRRIIFTNEDIILDCGIICERETSSGVLPQDHGYLSELQRSNAYSTRTMTLYETLLNRYLQRNLTYEEDILDAFQGISNYLGESDATKCCWCLPRKHFLPRISWFNADDSERLLKRQATRSEGRRWPSWAWPAWKIRRITFHINLGGSDHQLEWSEAKWQLADQTGILEIEDVDVIRFKEDLVYDETNAQDMELISNYRKA
jgi:Heterokaryon incompatibility protein (HET)